MQGASALTPVYTTMVFVSLEDMGFHDFFTHPQFWVARPSSPLPQRIPPLAPSISFFTVFHITSVLALAPLTHIFI